MILTYIATRAAISCPAIAIAIEMNARGVGMGLNTRRCMSLDAVMANRRLG